LSWKRTETAALNASEDCSRVLTGEANQQLIELHQSGDNVVFAAEYIEGGERGEDEHWSDTSAPKCVRSTPGQL